MAGNPSIQYTSSSTTSDTIWTYWTATTSCTATTITWYQWNDTYASATTSETAAQREQRQREAAERREQTRLAGERRQREAEEAAQKAQELLLQNLSNEQRAEYERERCFTVISKTSQRKYRIRHGRAQNIELLNEQGRPVKRLCAHPREAVPDGDTVLAQKLMLEHCEDEFLRIANVQQLAA